MQDHFEQLAPLAFPAPQPVSAQGNAERRDAALHRRRVLDAARALFAEYGVEQVSMHQIAQKAGVGQGTLYRRYAHKGLLCTAILSEDIERFQEQLRAALVAMGERTPAVERLYYLLERLLAFNEANTPLLSAIADVAGSERRQSQYHSPFYQWLRQVVLLLLRRARERQEIGSDDLEYAADLVLLPLSIDFYRYQRQRTDFTPARLLVSLRQFLARGLDVS